MGTKVDTVKKTITDWTELLKPCSMPPKDIVLAGYGTVLEVYNCEKNQFDKLSCGQDIELPKRTVGILDTSGAACDFDTSPDGFIYDTKQSAKRAMLESVTYTVLNTPNSREKIAGAFGKLTTYRVVAADDYQTFWAFNAILSEEQAKFPSGNEDTSNIEITLVPSGFMVVGELNPSG